MASFEASSRWHHDPVSVGRNLRVVERAADGDLPFDPDSVSPEGCFSLRRPAKGSAGQEEGGRGCCDLVLTQRRRGRRPLLLLSSVLVVGSFRRAEVRAPDSGEYLGRTFKGTRLLGGGNDGGDPADDGSPDLEVWRIDVDVRGLGLSSVELRFPGAPDESWVVSLAVGTAAAEEEEGKANLPAPPGSSGLFNMSRLDAMLGGVDLSERARDFKKLFSDFQQHGGAAAGAGGAGGGNFGALPQSLLLAAASAGAKNFSSVANARPAPRPGEDAALNGTGSLHGLGEGHGGVEAAAASGDVAATKQDLLEVERRVSAKMERLAAEQEAKMDRIICLLEGMGASKKPS